MARRLVEVTREAMFRGIRAVRPGATLGDVGHAIQEYAEAQRFWRGARILRPRHRPRVPRRTAGAALRPAGAGPGAAPGMTFTIEPMINEGSRHAKLLPDGWTVVTRTASCRRSGNTPSR